MHPLAPLPLLLLAAAAAPGAAAPAFSAAYRKDAYLQDYIETVPVPSTGGRLHVVGLAAASGAPARVYLNGSLVDVSSPGSGNPADWPLDWLRLEPAPGGGLVAGAAFWLSFHSRSATWDAAAAAGGAVALRVEDAAGAALVDGSFVVPPVAPGVRVTWATTAGARRALLVYLHNDGAAGATLVRASVNGGDVTALLPAAVRSVPAGSSVMWQLPATAVPGGVAPGSVWTVEATWAGAAAATAAGGLLWPEFFPVETWPHGSDCPFPTLNDTSYAAHRARGVDTFFTEWTPDSGCPKSHLTAADIVNVLAPQYGFHVLPSLEGGVAKLAGAINNTANLAGVFLADEDDTVVR